jgi:hypothetical protein
MLKNPVTLSGTGNAKDRVISEARRMWSHVLIPGPRETFPNIALSLDHGPEHHELVLGATSPGRGSLADEITRSRAGNSAEAKFFSTLLSPLVGAFFRAENKAAARQQGYQCRSERRPAFWRFFLEIISKQ